MAWAAEHRNLSLITADSVKDVSNFVWGAYSDKMAVPVRNGPSNETESSLQRSYFGTTQNALLSVCCHLHLNPRALEWNGLYAFSRLCLFLLLLGFLSRSPPPPPPLSLSARTFSQNIIAWYSREIIVFCVCQRNIPQAAITKPPKYSSQSS